MIKPVSKLHDNFIGAMPRERLVSKYKSRSLEAYSSCMAFGNTLIKASPPPYMSPEPRAALGDVASNDAPVSFGGLDTW